LPPDPLALGGIAERDGPQIPVLGRVEVDRILTVTSALKSGLRHTEEPNSLAPRLAPSAIDRDHNGPPTCAPSRIRTFDLLLRRRSLYPRSYRGRFGHHAGRCRANRLPLAGEPTPA